MLGGCQSGCPDQNTQGTLAGWHTGRVMSSKPAYHDGGWSCFLSNRLAPFCHTNKVEGGRGRGQPPMSPSCWHVGKKFFLPFFFTAPFRVSPHRAGLSGADRTVRGLSGQDGSQLTNSVTSSIFVVYPSPLDSGIEFGTGQNFGSKTDRVI